MSWFKTPKKTCKPSQHPPPSNIISQTGVGPSSISPGLNRGVRSGGVNNGNAPGGDRGTGRSPRGDTMYKGPATHATPLHESRTLKSVLVAVSAIYAHCEETALIANKVEDFISRIIALEEIFGTPAGDVAEQRRRILYQVPSSKLRNIEARFQSLYAKPPPKQLQEDGDLPELLEDLREAIFDFRMARQTELRTQERKLISSDEAAVLDGFPCSQQVELWHDNWRGCLKGTRRAILDKIELWARNSDASPVYWLNGLARTGKTAIAQTIAERVFADGQLGASFFCSRDFEDRNNLRLIFPTLAVQLARKYADFRSFLIPLVLSHPGIVYDSLDNQMQKLIVQPLQESNVSTLVIIDALDECKDKGPTSAILSVLAEFVSEIPNVKFLITSRPETHVLEGFRLPLLAEKVAVFVLHEVERSQVNNDVRLFFRHKLSDTRFTEQELDALCIQAAGSFVHALDFFYSSILQRAFAGGQDPDNDLKIRSVLGAIVLATDPLSSSTIAILLGLGIDDVFRILSFARPLLIPWQGTNSPVLLLYGPFSGFIVDPDRCTNKRFHVSPSNHHSQLLIGCLNLMDRTLEQNICQLSVGVVNSDISDLGQRIKRYINPALLYACRSWHKHLVDRHTAQVDTSGITLAIHEFLGNKFLFWLEVLSILGTVRSALNALQTVADWLEESPTLDLVNDCSRFVTNHFEIISASSRHIYHSAIVLTPEPSIVRKLYEARAQPLMRAVCGVLQSWDSATLATVCPFRVELVVWSPCNRYLAISPSNPVMVAILNSTTLQQLRNLKLPQEISSHPLALIFSPDSSMLTCSCTGPYSDEELRVVSWDIRTGLIVSIIKQQGPKAELSGRPFITYLSDGRMVGILYRYPTFAVISLYNVVTGAYLHNVPHDVKMDHCLPSGSCFYNIWTHGESIRFATAEPTTITVQEVGFIKNSKPKEVAVFPVPQSVRHTGVFSSPDATTRAQFLPALHRLALIPFSAGPALKILMWDCGDTEPRFLDADCHFRSPLTISSNGHFLACSTAGPEVYLWKESPTGYVLAAKLLSSTKNSGSLLSPNGKSIVVHDGSMVRLWRTNTLTTTTAPAITPTPTSVSIRPQKTENFILEFHPVSSLAAFARWKGSTVTILDLKSGLPHLTINTGVKVLGIRVVEDTVVVVSDGKVVTWELLEGNCLPDATMGAQDVAQMMCLGDDWKDNIVAASISFDLSYVAFITQGVFKKERRLSIYIASTGRRIGCVSVEGNALWFTPGGLVWCAVGNKVEVWNMTRNGMRASISMRGVHSRLRGFPWVSSCGYQVTNDGWILGRNGRRMLMLPPPLRLSETEQLWKGQYLALLHASLPEPVILEFVL